MEAKFKLLDKVVYEYVNFDKPVELEPMSQGCSAAPSYIPNDKVVGVIRKIKKTNVKEYIFDSNEFESEGEYDYDYTEYFITGWNKPLTASSLQYA